MSALEKLLQPGTLTAMLQPIVEVHASGTRLHGVECLMRGPEKSNLRRADILFSYVRKKNAEAQIDRACVSTALRAAQQLPDNVRISINIHASSLANDHGFLGFLQTEAGFYSLVPQRLTLEVVEHTPAFNGTAFQHALDRLRDFGVRIALDDIGLGSSNYKMILDCRPDYFKIDKYLVQGCNRDYHRKAVIKSVVTLAQSLGSHVVAEGVEQHQDFETVSELGINLLQGYLFGKPMTVADLLASDLLKRYRQEFPPQVPAVERSRLEGKTALLI
jgi:EAL domain-containing protein (putative c-di-GMP-specific phosphodiesterase class I)